MRLLVADDHDLLRDSLKAFLEEDGGFAVDVAADVPAAVRRVRQDGPYDLVLLDFHIPGMSNLIGLKRLLAANAGGRVAILSGVVTEDIAAEALRRGAAAVLDKTLPPDHLRQAILTIIEGGPMPAAEHTCTHHEASPAVPAADAS